MHRHLHGILALLLVTLVWGTTFPAMKDLTGHFSAVWIILVRFALAALILSPFLWRAKGGDLRAGAILGVLLFFCFIFQVEGLALTSSNRNAFICGLNVLVVPLLGMLAGRLPERRIVLALIMSIAGLAALCWDGGGWGTGDSLALMCALCFGVVHSGEQNSVTLRCRHTFHFSESASGCRGLVAWAKPICPLCRQSFKGAEEPSAQTTELQLEVAWEE